MNLKVISAAAANLLGGTALTTPAAPAAPAAPAPAATTGGEEPTMDVVSVADAQAAIAQARSEGAAAEVARTQKVLASASGKLHPATAAFMLQANPTATADQIVAHLDTMPAPTASAAPAPTEQPAPTPPAGNVAPNASAPLTVPLANTPTVDVPPAASNGGDAQPDADKFWTSLTAQQQTAPLLAGGVPRTGN